MKKLISYRNIPMIFGITILLLSLTACENELEIEDPIAEISPEHVYQNEASATAAVTTLYAKLRDETLLTGDLSGVGFLMGLYSDELDYYGIPDESAEAFYSHQILPENSILSNLWDSSYKLIYMCNAALEGIKTSYTLSASSKKQLTGEVLFVRALTHFYLVNLFGDIPYINTTDYRKNSKVERMTEIQVYQNIEDDLLMAQERLDGNYSSAERVRPNRYVVSALLSKVYLYRKNWAMAVIESSTIIDQTSLFELETLTETFLKESHGTIWQFQPKNNGDNTREATTYMFSSGPPSLAALSHDLIASIETGDLRKDSWIGEVNDGTTSWYFPYKYKQNVNTGTSQEYSIVFRLAEQYLIRAEARTKLGNLSGAKEDLNKVRSRAGLNPTAATNQSQLIKAIQKERKIELFTEYGNRWFDLKRTGHANMILSPIKSGWQDSDVLLPIPEKEILINPNLEPQNLGY